MAPRNTSDSDSDEPLAPSRPSDKAINKALRDVVANIFKSGKMEELTVKRVRLAAEKALGIEEGFFKGDATWKTKSDQIIKEEVVSCYILAIGLLRMELLSNEPGKLYRNREIEVQRNKNKRIKKSLLRFRRSLQKRNDQDLAVRRIHGSARKQTPRNPRRMRTTPRIMTKKRMRKRTK